MVLWANSWGFKLTLDVAVNITKATTMQIRYRKPSGEAGVWKAGLDTSTSIFYIVCKGDLDVTGIWEFQAYVAASDWALPGEIIQVLVASPI